MSRCGRPAHRLDDIRQMVLNGHSLPPKDDDTPTMSSVVELYEALASAPDERARARVIAEAFERLEERYPHLPDLATRTHLSETELRLRKDIEQGRADLAIQIEQLRSEMRESELRLQKEIEQLRGDFKSEIAILRGEMRETELRLQKEIEQLRGDLKSEVATLTGEIKSEVEKLRGEIQSDLAKLRGEIQVEVAKLHGQIQSEVAKLRGEVLTEIVRSRNTLLMWLIPLMFAQVGAITALVRIL